MVPSLSKQYCSQGALSYDADDDTNRRANPMIAPVLMPMIMCTTMMQGPVMIMPSPATKVICSTTMMKANWSIVHPALISVPMLRTSSTPTCQSEESAKTQFKDYFDGGMVTGQEELREYAVQLTNRSLFLLLYYWSSVTDVIYLSSGFSFVSSTNEYKVIHIMVDIEFVQVLYLLLLILHASCRRVLTAEFLFLSYFYSLVTIVTSCTSTPHTSYTFLNDTYLNDTYLITSKLIKCYQSKIFYRIHPLYRNHCLLL